MDRNEAEKKLKKPLDKLPKMCYNKGTKEGSMAEAVEARPTRVVSDHDDKVLDRTVAPLCGIQM